MKGFEKTKNIFLEVSDFLTLINATYCSKKKIFSVKKNFVDKRLLIYNFIIKNSHLLPGYL